MAIWNRQFSPVLMVATWIVLGGLLLGAPSLAFPWSARDNAAAVYMGATVVEGGAPYHDAWNVKAPGIDLACALSILLFGKSAFALRLLDLLWQITTALCIAFLAVRIHRQSAAGVIAGMAYLIFYFSQNYVFWAQPDGLLTLPLALAVVFLLRAQEGDRFHNWVLAGLGVGIAVIFKLVIGLFGVALLVSAIAGEGSRWNRGVLRPAALALGFAAPLAALAFYLRSKGALADFLTTQFVFAPEYAARLRHITRWACITESFRRPILIPLYGMAAAAIFSVFASRRDSRAGGLHLSRTALVLWAWTAAGGISLVMHGTYLGDHFLSLAAPLAILSSDPLHRLMGRARESNHFAPRLAVALVMLCLVVPAVALSRRYQVAWERCSGGSIPDRFQRLGTYLRDHTRPDEMIYVWGDVPVVYLYAERKAATRFLSVYFLSVPWRSVDYPSLFLSDLAAHRPVYFVLMKDGQFPGCLDPAGGGLQGFERLAGLRTILDNEYSMDKDVSEYTIYRRKSAGLEARPPG